jgi:fibronectin type 3 domain-containing protein
MSRNIIDTGLLASTTYQYRVRATDVNGNFTPYSNTATATTPTPDVTPPSIPTNLSSVTISKTEIDLTWTASTDNVAVSGYQVFRCVGNGCTPTVQIGAPAANSFNDLLAVCSTTYTYGVKAIDTSSNLSALSGGSVASTLNCLTPPVAPTGTTLPGASDFSRDVIAWSWTQEAGSPADGYHVKCGNTTLARTYTWTVVGPSIVQAYVKNIVPGQGVWYCAVTAYNAGGDSAESAEATTTVVGPGFGGWGFSY